MATPTSTHLLPFDIGILLVPAPLRHYLEIQHFLLETLATTVRWVHQ